MPMIEKAGRRVALVLGGGGLKGFAHIGVMQALEERGIAPSLYAGTSIGAFIAAAAAGGMPVSEMRQRAQSLARKDLFRIDHVAMLMQHIRVSSIYMEAPLRTLCEAVSPKGTFEELPTPLLVNTVDIERGTQVVWGLPGLRDVPVADAVYASCALPGAFPPGNVNGRVCVDGGVMDNLPASIAAQGMDAVVAVDVGSSDLSHTTDIAHRGFAAIYMRAATVMMHALQGWPLWHWQGPPMLLIRPRLGHIPWLGFGNTEEVIGEGYRAALEALDSYDAMLKHRGGVWPQHPVRIEVDRAKCTGCTTCVGLVPHIMGLDAEQKAYPRSPERNWSPADGDFVRHCPTAAIAVTRLDQTGTHDASELGVPPAKPREAA